MEYLLCPTEEDLGMLMSYVVINAHMCGWEERKRGAVKSSKGTKSGEVDSGHGASNGGCLLSCTKSHHSK
jgi:hypothetical protein